MNHNTHTSNSGSFSFVVTTDMHHFYGVRSDGVRSDGVRSDGVRSDGVRSDGVRSDEATGFVDACKAISKLGPGAFMISAGDIMDAGGVREIIDRQIGSDYPWYFVIGGHDLDDPRTLEYAHAYNLKLQGSLNFGPANAPETTYSFDHGTCHFVVLNQYFDGQTEAGQLGSTFCQPLLDWLSDDLAKTEAQHVFVFAHEPAFRHPDLSWDSEQAGGGYIGFRDHRPRDRFWRLLQERGALAYIHGHHHVYNRSRVRGVWDIEAGRCHSVSGGGSGDDRKPRTFLVVHVDEGEVSYDCYRQEPEESSFGLCERVVLAGGKEGMPPNAVAGGAIEVVDSDGDGEEEIHLDGSASGDSEGRIVSYIWEREGLRLADGETARIRLPVGYYRDVSLTVANERGITDRDVFPIWVKTQAFTGALPVVTAGDNLEVSWGNSATLGGNVVHDGMSIPEGKLRTQWTKQDGPGVVSFKSQRTPNTAARFSCPGIYVLSLEAFYAGLHSSDTVTVVVHPAPGEIAK